MGGGASKKYRQPEPEPEPACGEVLFTVLIDLDGSENLAQLHYREDHPDPESAAAAFVAEHGLDDAQVRPIAGAIEHKRREAAAVRAREEEDRKILAEKPKIRPPDGRPPRPAWHDETMMRSFARRKDVVAPPAGVATSGGVGIRHLSGAVAQARLLEAARYGQLQPLLECLTQSKLTREQLNAGGEDGAAPLHLAARAGALGERGFHVCASLLD